MNPVSKASFWPTMVSTRPVVGSTTTMEPRRAPKASTAARRTVGSSPSTSSPAAGSTGCVRWRNAALPPDAADADAADATPGLSTKAAATTHPSISLLMFGENGCRGGHTADRKKLPSPTGRCSHYRLLRPRNQPDERSTVSRALYARSLPDAGCQAGSLLFRILLFKRAAASQPWRGPAVVLEPACCLLPSP